MPVIPSAPELLVRESLLVLLSDHQRRVEQTGQARVLSLTLPVANLDPLGVLGLLSSFPNGQPHVVERPTAIGSYFYLEKPSQAESLLAGPPLLQLQAEGGQRFSQTQEFVRHWQAQLFQLDQDKPVGSATPAFGPRFCCSFTFFEHNPAGSPFAAATAFLPRWQVMRRGRQGAIVINLLLDVETDLVALSQSLTLQLDWLTELARRPLLSGFHLPNSHRLVAEKPDILKRTGVSLPIKPNAQGFERSVQHVLRMIENGQLRKLVLARSTELVTPRPVAVADALAKLRQRYPSCYIFALGNGSGQTFLGASPERLLSLQAEHLVVDALAGSTRRGQTLTEDFALAQGLLASEKDRREHQLIVEFILQALEKLGITPQTPLPPMLLQLPNIQHLQTLITARVPATLPLLSILQHLHPTPAVAGIPRRLACEQIRQLEPFERYLYAAPLGWIDAQGNGEFIVGLRSALIESNRVCLYAGAGIVAGSDPEREFQEIQLKLRALSETLFTGV